MRNAACFLLAVGLGAAVLAQSYVLESRVIDGGGRKLESAGYACGLSVGQTAASGVLASGGYRAVLGFWNRGFTLIGIGGEEPVRAQADRFWLAPCSPNPVANRAVVRFALPVNARVSLLVFDMAGRVVAPLVQARLQRGEYRVTWDIGGVSEQALPDGVYFLKLDAEEFQAVEKAVIAR